MNQTNVFDVAYIGAGPATIFSVLQLLKEKNSQQILIIEKGKPVEQRDRKKDIIYGYGGSGVFSDSKLSSDLYTTGGQLLKKMTQEEYERYEDIILGDFSSLLFEKLEWDKTKEINLNKYELDWLSHKTLHLGTERGTQAMKRAQKIMEEDSRVTFQFSTEVTDIEVQKNALGERVFKIKTSNPSQSFSTYKTVIATGQKGKLSSDILQKFKLPAIPRFVNIGIRVKDVFHEKYQEISKANYDFKISKTYNFINSGKKPIVVRLRTFCVNSGNAHLCEEKIKEFGKEYSLFNGHSFHGGGANNTINYGIVAEIEGLDERWTSKEAQTNRLWEINQFPEWKEDNLTSNGEVKENGRKLLEDFEDITDQPFISSEEVYCKNRALSEVYPKQLLSAYADFVHRLDKALNLSQATYFYPEAKPAGTRPNVTEDYEVEEIPGLFLAGDCVSSRGIIKAGITGVIIAEKLIKK